MPINQKVGVAWGADPQSITAIIVIRSGGNPNTVSKSNAIDLMWLEASTSGHDVCRRIDWSGESTVSELKDPGRNISMGVVYLDILETDPLAGIEGPKVLQYALVTSYANGAGTLLRTSSPDRRKATNKINDLDTDKLLDHVARNHSAPQALRYVYKPEQALDTMQISRAPCPSFFGLLARERK